MKIRFWWCSRFKFYYIPWHLAITTRHPDVDACLCISCGFIKIDLWTNKGWLKELGIK